MDPYELILRGEAATAAEMYSKEISRHPSAQALAGRAFALLNLNRLESAKADYQQALELQMKEGRTTGSAYMCSIGAISWLQGREEEAANTWREAVELIESGRITHSDLAGGVGVACLLWFAGVRGDLPEDRRVAEEFLKKRLRTTKAKYWPGPIGLYVLGGTAAEELRSQSEIDPKELAARQRCQAEFYVGVKAIASGDVEGFRKGMSQALKWGSESLIENEYYLARYELGRDTAGHVGGVRA